MPDYSDLIEKHARRVGVDPVWMNKIMRIESGGKAGSRTGSYKGLFQLSDKEFTRNGGTGSIYDPEQNVMAAANKISREKLQFEQKHDRPATLKDVYMIHQQGEAGYDAHLRNPDRPAWMNMAETGEGRRKGTAWAKRAIWGNIPDQVKEKYGNVENVSSRQFTDEVWGKKTGEKDAPVTDMPFVRPGEEPDRDTGTGIKWHRHPGSDKPAEEKKSAGFEFEPINPPQFQVPHLVPNIQLARIPE